MSRKRFLLTDLDLDRVDIVDVGANQGADIVIAKGMPDVGDVHVDSTMRKRPPRGKRKRSDYERLPAEGALRGMRHSAQEKPEKGEEGESEEYEAYRRKKKRTAAMAKRIEKHYGPGPHSNGTDQTVHASGGGGGAGSTGSYFHVKQQNSDEWQVWTSDSKPGSWVTRNPEGKFQVDDGPEYDDLDQALYSLYQGGEVSSEQGDGRLASALESLNSGGISPSGRTSAGAALARHDAEQRSRESSRSQDSIRSHIESQWRQAMTGYSGDRSALPKAPVAHKLKAGMTTYDDPTEWSVSDIQGSEYEADFPGLEEVVVYESFDGGNLSGIQVHGVSATTGRDLNWEFNDWNEFASTMQRRGRVGAFKKRIEKAGAMTPPDTTRKPPAPVAQPTPAAPKPPATGAPGTPPQPMAPGGGMDQKPAAPAPLGGGAMNPMAPGLSPGAGPMGPEFGAKPGQPRLQRLTPDMFEMTADSQTHKEWTLKPDQLPENMEAVVISMMSDGDGARYQWMMDPLDGPPQTGQSKTAPEAMMALRDAMTSYVATSAMQFMGGAAMPGMPGAPGASQRLPASPGAPAPAPGGGGSPAQGGSLLERLRAQMGAKGGGADAAKPGESRPAPAGGSNPAAREDPERKVRKALDLIARDFVEMNIVKAGTTGSDLRDILSSRTQESLSSMVSATKSADVEGARMPNIDIDTLAANLPDEVLDYIEDLEQRVADLSEVTKSLNPSVLPEDSIAKALDTLPPEVAAIVKADRERTQRLEKALADERIAKANAEWIAKADALTVVDNAEDLGARLRSLAEFDGDLANEVFKALELADRRVQAGALFAEVGKSGGSITGAEGKIEALAKGYRDADPTLSDEVARAMAYENHPEIYAEYLAERRGR